MIVGAGFAGFYCARWLDRKLATSTEVVLVNPGDHMVYSALLPDVAGGVVDPGAIATPLTASLPSTISGPHIVELGLVDERYATIQAEATAGQDLVQAVAGSQDV